MVWLLLILSSERAWRVVGIFVVQKSQLIAKVNKINPLLKGTKVGTNGRPFFSQIRGKLHQINESLIGS